MFVSTKFSGCVTHYIKPFLTRNYNVYTFGSGVVGATGHGDFKDYDKPTKVQALEGNNIQQISAGWGHCGCINSEHDLVLFGRTQDLKQLIGAGNFTNYGNSFAQKFNNIFKRSVVDTLYPSILPLDKDHAKQVSCSAVLTACCTEEGHVYTYGYNRYGQCGVNSKKINFFEPQKVLIKESDHIIRVSCGFQHCIALSDEGRVFSWGKAHRGQIGVTGMPFAAKPVYIETLEGIHIKDIQTGFNHSIMIDKDDNYYVCGKYWCSTEVNAKNNNIYADQMIPRLLELPHNINQFATGQYHMTFQDKEGKIFLLGMEDGLSARVLGMEDKIDKTGIDRMHHEPVEVDTTSLHGLIFKKLVCSFTDCYGITDDGYIYEWDWLQPPKRVSLYDDINVKDISFGWKHTMILGEDRPETPLKQ